MRRLYLRKRKTCRAMAGCVKVKLEGTDGRALEQLAIYDVGSPVSLVKRSAVAECDILADSGESFSWGTAAKVEVVGVVDLTVRWTAHTATQHRFRVVPDAQLPSTVAALLGNDMIWNLPCCIRSTGTCHGKRIYFDHDPIAVELMTFRKESVAQPIHHLCGDKDQLDVVVGSAVVVPPRGRMNILGSVVGRPETDEDLEALFVPVRRQDALNVWTAQCRISHFNREPWVLVGVMNLTSHPVHLSKGELLGRAHLAHDVVNLVAKPEGFVSEWEGSMAESPSSPVPEQVVVLHPGDPMQGSAVDGAASAAFLADEMVNECAVAADEFEAVWNGTDQPFRDVQVGGGESETVKETMFHQANNSGQEEAKAREDFQRLRESLVARLTPEQMLVVDQLLRKHEQFFSQVNVARADSDEYPFYLRIPTLGQRPVAKAPYHYPPDKLKALHDWVLQQVDRAHVEPTTSAWNAPIVLARKKDGRWRFAIDLRGLNEVSLFDPYILPRIHDLVELTEGCSWFSAMDLADGFWNCLVHPEDRHKLAFTVPGLGRFQWRSVPFGLHASAPHFQRAMEAMLAGLSWQETAVYVDDVLVYTKDFESHVRALDAVLTRLAQGGFVAAPAKCRLFEREVPYLGYRLSAKGIAMDPDYLARVRAKMVQFSRKDDIRTFMGAVQFYSRFVWACAELLAPMADALKKEIRDDLSNLSDQERAALNKAAVAVLAAMESGPVLALPNFDKEFVLTTDASNVALGAALCQEADDGTLRPICLWSRKLTATERNYSATEREALAIIYFVDKFKYYLLGRRFLLRTDHRALVHILRGAASNSKLARWALRLQEFNFDVAYIKGRENVLADSMSRMLAESSPVQEWNAGERGQYLRWKWSGDGEEEVIVPARPVHLPVLAAGDQPAFLLSDVETELRSPLVDRPRIDLVALQRADEEAKVLRQIAQGEMAVESAPSEYSPAWRGQVQKAVNEKRLAVVNGAVVYLSDELGPSGDLEAKRVRLFVPRVLRRALLFDKHDAPWSAHLGLRKTKARVTERFWWPLLSRDVEDWTSSCEDCQKADKGHHRRFGALHPLPPVMRPFERMGMDLVKIVSKKAHAAGGKRYALVVTDYATRFAIVMALEDKSAKTVAANLWHRLIAFTGPPTEIISDNGGEFRNVVKELTSRFGIHRTWTTPYHPRTNGLTERFNRTLVDMLCTISEGGKYIEGWEEYLPMLQLAYNTAWQGSVEQSPYFLMFGRQPSTPLEMELLEPTGARTGSQPEWKEKLEHARQAAVAALTRAQETQRRQYNLKRRETEFAIGDVVWLREGRVPKEFNRKTFAPLGGPYRVVAVHESNVVDIEHLSNAQGRVKRVNVERLMRTSLRSQEELSLEERVAAGIERNAVEDVEVSPQEMGELMEPVVAPQMALDGAAKDVGEHAVASPLPSVDRIVPPASANLPMLNNERVYEVRRIWAHRSNPLSSRSRQYLVEWEISGGERLGTWVNAADMNAKQAVTWYWNAFRAQSLPEWQEPKARRCAFYGFDNGCEHLNCRFPSWQAAMTEAEYDTSACVMRKSIISGGSDVEPRRRQPSRHRQRGAVSERGDSPEEPLSE